VHLVVSADLAAECNRLCDFLSVNFISIANLQPRSLS
jgi:hypothetical protein